MANPKPDSSVMAGPTGKQLFTNQQTLVADAKINYADDASANDLDDDAKRVAAANAANAKINSILDILEAHGLMKDA